MVYCCSLVWIHIAIKNGGKHCYMSHTRMGKGNPCVMFWPKSCGEVQKRMSFMRYRLAGFENFVPNIRAVDLTLHFYS